MKIFVFSDLHGSVARLEQILRLIEIEQPNKVVFCGDLFGGWSGTDRICSLLKQIDAVLYLVRGNNDIFYNKANPPCDFEEYAVMHHFGRTLFFSHGHIYNGYKLPTIIGEGDVLIHGHTHASHFYKSYGVTVLNVGSCAQPRDKTYCYLILGESGATLKNLDGVPILQYPWG